MGCCTLGNKQIADLLNYNYDYISYIHVIIVIQIINQPVRPPVTNNIIMHNIESQNMTITPTAPTAPTTLVERITGAKEGSAYQVSYYATNVVDIFSTTLDVLGKYMEVVSLLLIIIHFDNVIYIYSPSSSQHNINSNINCLNYLEYNIKYNIKYRTFLIRYKCM